MEIKASATATATVSATSSGSASGTGTGNTLDEANIAANNAAIVSANIAANNALTPYKGYSNFLTFSTVPKNVNTNEYVPIEDIDTNDFVINPNDNTSLICSNPGNWEIAIQYQMVYLGTTTIQEGTNCLLSGWINVNGIDEQYSDSTGYLNRVNTKNLITIVNSRYFESGDIIKFGIRSSSEDGSFNVNCQTYMDFSGVSSTAVCFTAIKALNHFECIGLENTPITVNTNQYVPLAFNNLSDNWDYDPDDNTTIICKNAGRWEFTSQYQMVNIRAAAQGSYAQVSGWFNVNGVDIPNSNSTSYISLANGKEVFIIGYAQIFIVGDKIKFGIRASNDATQATLNTICSSFLDTTGVISSSVFVSCLKARNIANVYSTLDCPKIVNTNEYIPLTNLVGTSTWAIDPIDNTKFICIRPRTWRFIVQLQMVNQIPVEDGINAQICTWFNVNGVNIENTDSTGYVARKGSLNILTACYCQYFNVGDIIKFGIRSTSDNGTLNAICQSFTDTTGVYNTSVTITAASYV